MRVHKNVPIIMVLAFFGIVFSGCSKSSSPGAKDQISIMQTADLQSLDTTTIADPSMWNTLTQTSEGMYRINKNNKIVPAMSTKLVKPTNNGKTYVFHIRKDAKWNNGEAVTAQDFVTSWRRSLNPKATAGYSFIFAPIKNATKISQSKKPASSFGVQALNTRTLKIELTHAVPYFNKLLTLPVYFPQNSAFIKKYGSRYGTTAKTFSSNGPFKIEGWQGNNKTWKLVRNKYYYDQKDIKLMQMNVSVVTDANTAYNLFQEKKLDEAQITGTTARSLQNTSNLQRNPTARTYYMSFNMTGKSPFKNIKLRQAINLVINRTKLAKNVVADGSRPAYTFAGFGLAKDPITTKDFSMETTKKIPLDVSKAKKLWSKGIKEQGLTNKPVKINLVAYGEPITKNVIEYIQSDIQQNFKNTRVSINNALPNVWISKVMGGNFGINYVFWHPDYSDPMSNLENFTSNNPKNYGKFSDKYYDKQISEAQTINGDNPKAYWKNMRNAEQELNKQLPLIPLYYQTDSYLVNKKLQGVAYHPVGETDYTRVHLNK